MLEKRTRLIGKGDEASGPVVYWMSRDQRVNDNWALVFAQQEAIERKKPLVVLFCLVPSFLEATLRQYGFMLKGLEKVEETLQNKKNIPFVLLRGNPEKEIPVFLNKQRAAILVTDFDPLKIKRKWKKRVIREIAIPAYEVDAHNIVPAWIASPKQEYAAYTIRPKIHKLLPDFLVKFPGVKKHPYTWKDKVGKLEWSKITEGLKIDRSLKEIDWLKPGEKAAKKMLKRFITEKLSDYDEARNDPTLDGQSNLSAYLHFGQIAPQRVALEVQNSQNPRKAQEAFLEELIVRRELSDNFCLYNDKYDSFDGFPDWAKNTLNQHRKDERTYTYSLEQFEQAETHDELWNAAQLEMVKRGKTHGYMRMYWAKKILEWTENPEEAMAIALYLNDKYEIDGRDPNGYTGVAWSIGGVHDRAWQQRAVYGKIRYMSYNGSKSKFDVEGYIKKVQEL